MNILLLPRSARRAAALLSFLFFALAPFAQAGDHGGGGGPAPLKFTVNLGSPPDGRFLQLEMILEGATPEVGQAIAARLPRIQHNLILLLPEQDEKVLRTVAGKNELAEKIQAMVNKILDETPKTGVSEVLFTSFLIQ